MNSMLGRGVFVAVALAIGIGLSAGPVAADEQIVLVERAINNRFVDNNDEGDSVGDVLIFTNSVYDADNKTVVGYDSGWCIRTVIGEASECSWTTNLENGQIMVQGPFYDQDDSVLAIVGGTGAYAGARGELWLHARNNDGTEYDFTFVLKN